MRSGLQDCFAGERQFDRRSVRRFAGSVREVGAHDVGHILLGRVHKFCGRILAGTLTSRS